jgi:hypothetical protein
MRAADRRMVLAAPLLLIPHLPAPAPGTRGNAAAQVARMYVGADAADAGAPKAGS